MGVYPGSRVCLVPERIVPDRKTHLSVSFRRTDLCINTCRHGTYARSKSSPRDFIAATNASAEYHWAGFSRQARRQLRADQLITVCGDVAYVYAFLLLDNLHLTFPEPCSACHFCAILYTKYLLLGYSETILLTPPTKILSAHQSQTAYPALSKLPAGLLFILDRDVYARNAVPSSHFLARLAPSSVA